MDDGGVPESQAYLDGLLSQAKQLAETVIGLQDEVRALTVTAASPDRLVTATVGAYGRLVDLTIDPRVYRDPDSAVLAAAIRSVVERAQAAAERAEAEIRAKALPPAADLSGAVGLDLSELTGVLSPAAAREERRDGTSD